MTADQGTISTLGHTTYERLRDMILNGELPAGASLQEKKLAERLGVSRTPVREATMRLMTEGLVLRSAGATPVVRRLSVDDFIEVLHIRRLLEVEAAGRAAQTGGSPELSAVAARIAEFRDGVEPTPAEHVAVDDRLHLIIAGLAGSRLLAELIEDLRKKTRIFDMGRVPERFEPGVREHLAIIDAITARDASRAQDAMREHIDNVRASVMSHLRRFF
ncbi:GntR family transcriptional regulator [Alsobacter metallidurans]|uniref:GntR family transcriptional regulator n=1 Tax=Alsobacter metallidurans TaxID=340221 RepID=A0A917I7F8_9HYPH|nr:GntR family transcriptional regulator [Alsobacter metallidurans]